MAAVVTDKRYRIPGLGFGVAYKVVTTGVNTFELKNAPATPLSISVQKIQAGAEAESGPVITQSGTTITCAFEPAPTATFYINVVG